MINNLLAAVILALAVTPAAAEVTKFHCTFAEANVQRPTPTEIVFSVDTFSQYGRIEMLKIPGVSISKNQIRVERNDRKVLSVEWPGNGYQFTAEALDKGAKMGVNFYAIEWPRHRFSVFLKKQSMTAVARSRSTGASLRSGHSSGACVQLR